MIGLHQPRARPLFRVARPRRSPPKPRRPRGWLRYALALALGALLLLAHGCHGDEDNELFAAAGRAAAAQP